MITIDKTEIIGLYLFFKKNEKSIDKKLLPLINRIEKELFEILTIDEYENIETLYDKMLKL